MKKTRKLGISMPVDMADDLDYLASAAGVSRSEAFVTSVGPLFSDLAAVMREAERAAAGTGLNVTEVAFGPRAMDLFRERMEEAEGLLGTFK